MEVRNCKTCGKLFNYLGGPPICPSCTKGLEEKFDEVKQYVYDHPGAGIQEVSTEMDVSVAQIRKWLREERLSFSESSEIALECEKCGKRILTGRFCNVCKSTMTKDLSNMYHKEPEPPVVKKQKTENKMRFLEK